MEREKLLRPTVALALLAWLAPFAVSVRPAAAESREVARIVEIESAVTPETLVVFDIDNTLLAPAGQLGSDQWFYFIDSLYKLQGMGEKEAGDLAMRVWNEAQRRVTVGPLEPDTVALLARLAARGVPMMALTARTLDIAELTATQLATAGLSLEGRLPGARATRIPRAELGAAEDALFAHGVLFVGESNDKGKVLSRFLQMSDLRPARVVFVDDKARHVKNVEAALSALGVPSVAFRYGGADARVEQFNAVMSEVRDAATARLFLNGVLVSPGR